MLSLLKLESNLKALSPEPWTLFFRKRLNILWGSNGSGKSAIQESLTLALSGAVYESFFRNSVASGNLLKEMIPKGASELFIELKTTDGLCSYKLKATGGRPQRLVASPPPGKGPGWEVVNPSELRDIIKGTAATQVEFFSQIQGDNKQPYSDFFHRLCPEHRPAVAASLGAEGDADVLEIIGLLKVWKQDVDAKVKLIEFCDANLSSRPAEIAHMNLGQLKAESKQFASSIAAMYKYLTEFLVVTLDSAAELASKFTGMDIKAHLDVDTFYFTMNGHRALSSGQEALLLAGLTAALFDHPRSIIMLSDRGMSETFVRQFMVGMVNFNGFVFLSYATDKEPNFAETSLAWDVIDANAVRRRK